MKSNLILKCVILAALIIVISSCAPAETTEKVYGFFYGLIHGLVFIIALFAKLFDMDYGLYAENNTGFTYWLGYILGVFIIGGGGGSAASRRRRRD
jgi:prepilin signal peptidase PulO-like enzyme (type II secretory pathway)